jgi:hypothetical protein
VDACSNVAELALVDRFPLLAGRFPLQALNRKAQRVNELTIIKIKKRRR